MIAGCNMPCVVLCLREYLHPFKEQIHLDYIPICKAYHLKQGVLSFWQDWTWFCHHQPTLIWTFCKVLYRLESLCTTLLQLSVASQHTEPSLAVCNLKQNSVGSSNIFTCISTGHCGEVHRCEYLTPGPLLNAFCVIQSCDTMTAMNGFMMIITNFGPIMLCSQDSGSKHKTVCFKRVFAHARPVKFDSVQFNCL